MTVVDPHLEQLWALLSELSSQLSANREHCALLQRQAEDLKNQAVHAGTGFTLRRFNTDISKEQFESELERFNASLVVENHALQRENRQLSMLLKEYEDTLDKVMSRFRSFAHGTQQHELELTHHYESLLLDSSPTPAYEANRQALDPLTLSMSLSHLSSLVRNALRQLQGEDPETPPQSTMSPTTAAEPSALLDESTGGYLGRIGSAIDDGAMDQAVELERLRQENAELRQLLAIANEPPSDAPS